VFPLRRPRNLRHTVLLLVIIGAGLIGVRTFLCNWYVVRGQSMSPTLEPGTWVICNRLAYGLSQKKPQPGELVVVELPALERTCVKRVQIPPDGQRVASDEIWIEGDNSKASLDSRQFGPIPLQWVLGRVEYPRR